MANRNIKRTVLTYSSLADAATWFLCKASSEPSESSYYIMASLVFSAFSFEAALNHVGKRRIKDWEDNGYDGERWEEKVDRIANHLEFVINKGKRPFQTVKWVMNFRNRLAHGRTEERRASDTSPISNGNPFDMPLPKDAYAGWEQCCTIENAKRADEDVFALMLNLFQAAGLTYGEPDLEMDFTETVTRPQPIMPTKKE